MKNNQGLEINIQVKAPNDNKPSPTFGGGISKPQLDEAM